MWSKVDQTLSIHRVHQGIAPPLHPNKKIKTTSGHSGNNRFGFVIESTQARQALKDHCGKLTTIGDLGTKYYGLAFPKGSPYLTVVNRLIVRYNEDGRLGAMRAKWFGSDEDLCPGKTQEEVMEEKRATPFSKSSP